MTVTGRPRPAKASPEAWRDLFDPSYRARSLAVLAERLQCPAEAMRSSAADVRTVLLYPVEAYIAKRAAPHSIDTEAASAFARSLRDLCACLVEARPGGAALSLARVGQAWAEWIASASAHYVYDIELRRSETNRRNAARPRPRAAAGSIAPDLQQVANLYRDQADRRGRAKATVQEIRAHFHVSERQAYRLLAEARAAGLLP